MLHCMSLELSDEPITAGHVRSLGSSGQGDSALEMTRLTPERTSTTISEDQNLELTFSVDRHRVESGPFAKAWHILL